MKIVALLILVVGISMTVAAPQDIHSAILSAINSAVPSVAVNIRPPPGGVSAFAAAEQQNGPSGSLLNAQTGISQGSSSSGNRPLSSSSNRDRN